MNIYAIADLHLCFGTPEKSMEIFGPDWENYVNRIHDNWIKVIKKEDLVLLPGDISWAKTLEEAKKDFDWIESLPGTKVMIKGNHDYFWSSVAKLKSFLPPSIHFIHNNAYNFENISICGARLWDSPEFNFDSYIKFRENPAENKTPEPKDNDKIYQRELHRLQLSLNDLNKNADIKIAMTHYPPIGADLKKSKISEIYENYEINYAVFGHLHHVDKTRGPKMFGINNGVSYFLVSADYLQFVPKLIV